MYLALCVAGFLLAIVAWTRLLAFLIMLFQKAARFAGSLVHEEDLAALDSSELSKNVIEVVKEDFAAEVVVTTASEVELYDPDPHELAAKMGPGRIIEIEGNSIWLQDGKPKEGVILDRRLAWCPIYSSVNELCDAEKADVCLASAALPFGIVRPVKVGGGWHVDGGVVDNAPVFPLLHRNLDEIVVILLHTRRSRRATLRELCLDEASWKRRVSLLNASDLASERGPNPDSGGGRQSVQVKKPPEKKMPKIPEITVIHPVKALDRWWRPRLLSFEQKYIQKIMCMGFRETEQRLNVSPLRTT